MRASCSAIPLSDEHVWLRWPAPDLAVLVLYPLWRNAAGSHSASVRFFVGSEAPIVDEINLII
jgi:hypothetical protein